MSKAFCGFMIKSLVLPLLKPPEAGSTYVYIVYIVPLDTVDKKQAWSALRHQQASLAALQYFCSTYRERMSGAEAVEIFWELPELVRNLLPYLDVYSIASLASIHQPTIRILKEDWGHSLMSKRIRESELPCN